MTYTTTEITQHVDETLQVEIEGEVTQFFAAQPHLLGG